MGEAKRRGTLEQRAANPKPPPSTEFTPKERETLREGLNEVFETAKRGLGLGEFAKRERIRLRPAPTRDPNMTRHGPDGVICRPGKGKFTMYRVGGKVYVSLLGDIVAAILFPKSQSEPPAATYNRPPEIAYQVSQVIKDPSCYQSPTGDH